MAIITFNAFDFLPVMAVCTVLQESLPVSFTRRVTVPAFQTAPPHMGVMGKFNIIKRNNPFLDAHMAEAGAGHASLKFPGFMASINDSESLLRLIVRNIEKFKGILNIVNPLAKKDEAVIVASLVEQILCLL
jgi:hypothetical protein